jgi:hypothetical protein
MLMTSSVNWLLAAVLPAVRAEGEPGRAEQAGREEAVAAIAVRFGGDVVVRAHREDGLLPPLQEPPAVGVARQAPHKRKQVIITDSRFRV